MPTKVEILGLKELVAQITAIRDVELKRQLRVTNLKGAKTVLEGAIFYTPVDSGDLLASLKAIAGQSYAAVKAGGGNVPYGAVIHWGWPAHNITANKFIMKAADELFDQVQRTYEIDFDLLMQQVSALHL